MLNLKKSAALFIFFKHFYTLLFILFSMSSISFASTTASVDAPKDNPILVSQRKIYKQAIEAYKKRRHSTFKRLAKRLQNYPLQPYIEYRTLSHQLGNLSSTQISNFLQANDDTVIGDRFRLKLIKQAARTQNWQLLIDVYRPIFGVASECRYLNALMHTQNSSIAIPKIQHLWLSPRSQPKACNTVFEQWTAAGFKTPELIWQRFKLALFISNRKLARYLIRSMPKDDAKLAKLWLKVHRNPSLVTSPKILNIQHPELTSILIHGLRRLAYQDVDKAIAAYYALKHIPFSEQQTTKITRDIGLRLARNHIPDAGIWLSHIADDTSDKYLMEWKIRTAIRQGDWSMVKKGIANLSLEDRAAYRWQYWWAHANEQLGNTIDADGIYQYLATKRSYYGFLAADRLNLPYDFEDRPVNASTETIEMMRQQPEAMRAHEFYLMGEILPARREWHRLVKRISDTQRLTASKLAQSWGWHDQAIITMGKTRYRDDITLRFPLQHDSKIHNWSHKHHVDPAWTYAIIRRESAFMYDARSPVGAMGLMQIMPNTARHIARKLKIRYRGRNSLLVSSTNIRLGTGYLGRMYKRLDNQHVLATAAYNAGPSRVEKWLPETRTMDAIRWIETIPFSETREYVSNVLAYMAIYEHRLKRNVTRLSYRMPPVPAKNPPIISKTSKKLPHLLLSKNTKKTTSGLK